MLPWCSYNERLYAWWLDQAEAAASIGRWELECVARWPALWPNLADESWQAKSQRAFHLFWPGSAPACDCHPDCFLRLWQGWNAVWRVTCSGWVTVTEERTVA